MSLNYGQSNGNSIVLGIYSAGLVGQGGNCIAIGNNAGTNSQGSGSVAIGYLAGFTGQGIGCVAVGNNAGNTKQSDNAVAIGINTGQISQGNSAIAIGINAGTNIQGIQAIAIGGSAGSTGQGTQAVAIGLFAGQTNQGANAISIGTFAGTTGQGANGVAIGTFAGQTNQGASSIAIGYAAGNANQPANSIILNATGSGLNGATASACYVAPIRDIGQTYSSTAKLTYYDSSSKEIHTTSSGLTLSNITIGIFNYNTGGGGSTQNITLPNQGVYLITSGHNLNDANIAITFMINCSTTNGSRIVFQYAAPGFNVVITAASGSYGFSISASYPSNYTSFQINYLRLL